MRKELTRQTEHIHGHLWHRGLRGRDGMVVGFTPEQSMSTTTKFVSSWRGVLGTTLCDKVFQ